MFQAEIISYTTLDYQFHTYVEQCAGYNPATLVQQGKRPRADKALMLAYLEAFANPDADTSDVKHLLGLLYFGVLVAGEAYNFEYVLSQPHGLRCLMGHQDRNKGAAIVFTGDGIQWESALKDAGRSHHPEVQAWGRACHAQFAKHNLDELIGRMKPDGKMQYLLE